MKKIFGLVLLIFLYIDVYASNLTLNNLKVNGEKVNCEGYTCEVVIDSKVATITFEKSDSDMLVDFVSGNSVVLNELQEEVKIRVSNDSASNTYKINIKQLEKNSDITLSELYLNNKKITLKEEVFVYNATVAYNIEELSVKVVPNSNLSKVNGKLTIAFPLDESSKAIDFTVEAENGDKKNYRIVVLRNSDPNTFLKSLTINGNSVAIKKNTFNYNVSIYDNGEELEVLAEPSNSSANVNTIISDNIVTIEVTRGTSKSTYNINVKHLTLTDNSLKLSNLKVSGYKELNFKNNILSYDLYFKNIPNTLKIDASSNKDNAEIEILNNENLEDGSVVTINLSLNDEVVSYQLNIKKEKVDDQLIIIIAIILLVITMIVLLILEIRDRKKKKYLKNTLVKEEAVRKEAIEIEEIEIL